MIETKCIQCEKIFFAKKGRIIKGEAKFCSLPCYRIYSAGKRVGKHVSIKTEFKKGHKPLIQVFGENHHGWKGQEAKYSSKHNWVLKRFGRAREKRCFDCGISGIRLEWANIDHKYMRNIGDYLPLCCSCHRRWDFNHKIRKNN